MHSRKYIIIKLLLNVMLFLFIFSFYKLVPFDLDSKEIDTFSIFRYYSLELEEHHKINHHYPIQNDDIRKVISDQVFPYEISYISNGTDYVMYRVIEPTNTILFYSSKHGSNIPSIIESKKNFRRIIVFTSFMMIIFLSLIEYVVWKVFNRYSCKH